MRLRGGLSCGPAGPPVRKTVGLRAYFRGAWWLVGPAGVAQIGWRRPGRSDLRPLCNYILLQTVPLIREPSATSQPRTCAVGEQRHTEHTPRVV